MDGRATTASSYARHDAEAQGVAELDPVTGEVILSRSMRRILSRGKSLKRITDNKEDTADEIVEAAAEGSGEEASDLDHVQPDPKTAAILEKQKEKAFQNPMTAMLDMMTIARLKRMGRKRRLKRRRAVQKTQRELSLQKYLEECVCDTRRAAASRAVRTLTLWMW
mgnify:CR=1 FL=1